MSMGYILLWLWILLPQSFKFYTLVIIPPLLIPDHPFVALFLVRPLFILLSMIRIVPLLVFLRLGNSWSVHIYFISISHSNPLVMVATRTRFLISRFSSWIIFLLADISILVTSCFRIWCPNISNDMAFYRIVTCWHASLLALILN